jgi:transcriptional regulator with XRE-family HTH domain
MTLLLREAIGERLRRTRAAQSRTLREVSRAARVSLGYLSEVERGRKEASSELLASICDALDLPLDELLRGVADDLGPVYLPEVPDTVPAGLVEESAGTGERADAARARRAGLDGGRLVGTAAAGAAGARRIHQSDLRIATAQAGPTTARAMAGAAA